MVADTGGVEADGIENGDVGTAGALTKVGRRAIRIEPEKLSEGEFQGILRGGVVASREKGTGDKGVTGSNRHRGVHLGAVFEFINERCKAGRGFERDDIRFHIRGVEDLQSVIIFLGDG